MPSTGSRRSEIGSFVFGQPCDLNPNVLPTRKNVANYLRKIQAELGHDRKGGYVRPAVKSVTLL